MTNAEIEVILNDPNASEADIVQVQAILDSRPDYGEPASSYRYDNYEHRS